MTVTSTFRAGSDVRRLLSIAFFAAIVLSLGGWVWFLGIGIRWLIVKL